MVKKTSKPKVPVADPLLTEFRQVLAENGIAAGALDEALWFPLYVKYPGFPKAIKLIAAVYGESVGRARLLGDGAALEPALVCLMCHIVAQHDYRITDWKRRLKGVSPREFLLLAIHGAKATLDKRSQEVAPQGGKAR